MTGRGYYQEWGKDVWELHPGDVVVIPAGVKRWHIAAADSWFAHLAVEVPGKETFADYDSYLILSHFKGHAMAGFGVAIKNISIGLGSSEGKSWIHSGVTSLTSPWGGEQDAFLESMAEAGKSVSVSFSGLEIDPTHRKVCCNDKEISLTAKEYDLLCLFCIKTGCQICWNTLFCRPDSN